MSLRGRALRLLVAGVAAVGLGYLSAFLPGGAPVWGAALVVGGTALSLVAAMALGAAKDQGLGGLLPVFGFVLLAVGGGLGALLFLPATEPGDPTLILGLPPRAALLLYGVGLLPIVVVPFAYARTFERFTLSEEDLDRIRRRRGTGAAEGRPSREMREREGEKRSSTDGDARGRSDGAGKGTDG